MNKIIENLNWRYATKAFDASKKITKEDLDTIIEAFRLTPSSFGLQPWKLVVVKDQTIKDSLVEHSWGQTQVSNCSDLLVLTRKNDFWDKEIEDYIADIVKTRWGNKEDLQWYENMMKWALWQMNDAQKEAWADKQIYIALWNIMTVCATMGIDTCPMEWFIADKYDEILWLIEKWLWSVVVLPIWYRDSQDKYSQFKKVRFPTEEILEII